MDDKTKQRGRTTDWLRTATPKIISGQNEPKKDRAHKQFKSYQNPGEKRTEQRVASTIRPTKLGASQEESMGMEQTTCECDTAHEQSKRGIQRLKNRKIKLPKKKQTKTAKKLVKNHHGSRPNRPCKRPTVMNTCSSRPSKTETKAARTHNRL